MNVLVTGGCGYKGSVLVPKLLDLNFNVHVIDTLWFGNYFQPHENLFVENPVNTTESYHFNSSFCIKFSSDTRHNKNKNWVYESTSF